MRNFNSVLLLFIIFLIYQSKDEIFLSAVFGLGAVGFIIIDIYRKFCETKQDNQTLRK